MSNELDRLREIHEREQANLQSLLEPDVPAGLDELMSGCRPFTGATLALMQQTGNEWLHRRPVTEMRNHYMATLEWLFMQAAPEKHVRRVVWNLEDFRNAALDWGNEDVNGAVRITPEILAAADAIIQHTLGLVDAANFAVVEKPGESPADEGDAPPN